MSVKTSVYHASKETLRLVKSYMSNPGSTPTPEQPEGVEMKNRPPKSENATTGRTGAPSCFQCGASGYLQAVIGQPPLCADGTGCQSHVEPRPARERLGAMGLSAKAVKEVLAITSRRNLDRESFWLGAIAGGAIGIAAAVLCQWLLW